MSGNAHGFEILGADHTVCRTVILGKENRVCEFEMPEDSLQS